MIKKNEVYLFSCPIEEGRPNSLKTFHAFLGYSGERRPFRYAYSTERPNPVPGATVLESICIERASCMSISGKEIYSKEILNKISNPYIIKLIEYLGDLNIVPSFSKDNEHSKLAELVRVITTTTPYILLESPETYLSDIPLRLIKKALSFELSFAKENGMVKQVYIYSNSPDIWLTITNNTVARDAIGVFYVNESSEVFDASQPSIEEYNYLKKTA